MSAPAAGAPTAARGDPPPRVAWRTLTMVGALALIWIAFSVATDGTFLSPRNLSLLARQMAVTSILATGMVLVIVAGQIDLSVGALSGLMGAVSTIAATRLGWPLPLAFLLALAAGAGIGGVQGSLIAWLRIPPFIVTLGGMLLFQGSLLGLTRGVTLVPPPGYLAIGQTYLPVPLGWVVGALAAAAFGFAALRAPGPSRVRSLTLALTALAVTAVMNAYHGIPVPVLLVLAIAGLLSVIATRTPFGRHLYAVGGNREAAFYSGIPIERRIVGVFMLMGLLTGIAGVVLTARVGAATTDAGRMMELDAIAAAVIGGTSLLGGRGSVWGALLGAMVMASLDNGMSLLNTEPYWQPILKGGILVAAVAADVAGRRR
jgi:D-xylose transport system permease protein